SEVQEICDEVAFVNSGKLVAHKTLEELLKSQVKHVQVTSTDERLKTSLSALPGVEKLRKKKLTYEFQYTGDTQKLVRELARHKVIDLNVTQADLENIFMQYYKEAKKDA